MTSIFFNAALLLAVYMCCMFIVGLRARDNSLVDIAYGPAFLVACWGAWFCSGKWHSTFAPYCSLACSPFGGCALACISAFGIAAKGRISAIANFVRIGAIP